MEVAVSGRARRAARLNAEWCVPSAAYEGIGAGAGPAKGPGRRAGPGGKESEGVRHAASAERAPPRRDPRLSGGRGRTRAVPPAAGPDPRTVRQSSPG
ncbi:hypothetical protein GCM10010297_58350 [Streptomyces malachitofuscus]|nr:hypothetical protein GCM10010297_58350 [Streptomyces malachitofuscus]